MKVVRATKPEHVDLIAARLFNDGSMSRAELAGELKAWLRQRPDDILIIQAWDDNRTLCGFLVCVAEPGKNHTWLWQAWQRTGMPPSVTRQCFAHVVEWSRTKGKKEIRAETFRNGDAIHRRWGFRPLHTIVSFDLNAGGAN
jgi:hypothetical protein